MPVINASVGDLVDAASLVRWFTNELISNHHFTARHGNVNDSAVWSVTDAQRWLDRPQSETFYNQYDICLGIKKSNTIRGHDLQPIGIGLQAAPVLFSVIDPGSGTRWSDNTWWENANTLLNLPPDSGGSGASKAGHPAGVDNLEAGNFISARIITNPTSTSATPSEPLYFYCVIEYETSKFRKFGFGEVLKYYDWEGGLFYQGDIYGPSAGDSFYTGRSRQLFGSGIPQGTGTGYTQDAGNGHLFAPGWTGVAKSDAANGRGWLSFQSLGSSDSRCWPCMGWDSRMPLLYFQYSPSSFSLQSARLPAVIFGGGSRRHTDANFEIHPMGVFPDLFQAVITNVDAYGVFQEVNGDKYMVVPHISKLVSEFTDSSFGSGRHGILIRNPDLIATIT